MKRESKINLYRFIYTVIAIATFKHSSWAFSYVLEGTPQKIDWAAIDISGVQQSVNSAFSVLDWLSWIFWGWLMAFAVDVAMFAISRDIQNTQTHKPQLWKWLTYAITALGSGYTQFFYASHHASPLAIVTGTIAPLGEGGFLNILLQWSILILPLMLPLISTFFTVFIRAEMQVEFVAKTAKGKIYTTNQAVEYLAQKGKPVTTANLTRKGRDENFGFQEDSRWYFTEQELEEYAKSQY